MPETRFYNTLTHRVEPFEPLAPPVVTMYNCGPTVYDYAHIGNFRAFVFADLLRRFLELTGHTVHQVMNLTDVGHMTDDQLADGAGQDKMKKAQDRLLEAKKSGALPKDSNLDPTDPYQIAGFYTDAFLDDARALSLKVAQDDPANHRPRATDHIQQMIALIQRLVEADHAYAVQEPSGHRAVYYKIESFPEYGRLSGNTLDRLRSGAGGRVNESNQALKQHPADFLLWKEDPTHLMKWDSPWGAGYPGWHIECSAMALSVLSELTGKDLATIDIHTGGEDNIFPHHECEIAQSTGATGQPFAQLWMHTRFLLVEGQKMSKSKGNFYTVRDVLSGKATEGKAIDPAVLRFELLKSHYRSNLNFTAQGLADSAAQVQRLRIAAATLDKRITATPTRPDPDHPMQAAFTAALADDLNISGALAAVFDWLGDNPPDQTQNPAEARALLGTVDSILAVLSTTAADGDVQTKCRAIDEARTNKDYATADRLRTELIDAGYNVLNTPAGTVAEQQI